jgi:hypothetical protein
MKKIRLILGVFILFFSCEKQNNSVAALAKGEQQDRGKITFEKFKAVYNANAEKFSAEPISEWSLSIGEKANTARYDFGKGSMLITLENKEPYYVSGGMFVVRATEDSETLQALFKIYTLALSFEPEETPEGIIDFCQTLFTAEPNTPVKSKSGNTYSAQELQGNMVITITKAE